MKTIQETNQAKEAVQSYFTGAATDYSKLFLRRRSGSNFSFRGRLTLATEMTAGIAGRLLDCACGSGEITAAVLAPGRFSRATVVDLSPRMLELAGQRLAGDLRTLTPDQLEFRSADIFEFVAQPQAGSYDLILCLGLIAHTGRLDDLLAGLVPRLAPAGKILLQTTLLDHWGTKVVRALTGERYHRKYGYRISYFRHEDILRAAHQAGLESAAMRRFTFGLPFADRVWPGMNYRLERGMQNWSKAHGAEALFLLQRREREQA
jgi:SAM-dependent methyltransferase